MRHDNGSSIIGDTFITREFQIRFVLKFCLITLLGGLLFSGLIFYLCQDTLSVSFHESRLVLKRTSFGILPAIIYTNLTMLAVALIGILTLAFYSFRKIIKPMFRCEDSIKAIGNGDLRTKIRYRTRDQTNILGQKVNLMTESLNRKISDFRTDLQKVIESAAREDVSEKYTISLIRLHRRIGQSFKL